MSLTADQIRFFRHNGFLKLPGLLPEDHLERLKQAILHGIQEEIEPVAKDAEGRVHRISQVLDRESIFFETARQPVMLASLTSLLGPNIEIVKNRHNHATLNRRTSRPDRFHRDVCQWTRSVVTVIFYLEESTLEKGCTMLVPGSHLLPGMRSLYQVEEEDWVKQSGLLSQAVPAPMRAGGMLAIDSLIFHRIGENRTDQTRMSVTFGYHSVDDLSEDQNPLRVLACGEQLYGGNVRKSSPGPMDSREEI